MINAGRIVAKWASWMRSEGLAERTIRERCDTILRFERRGLDVVGADAQSLVDLLGTEGWKPQTRATYYRVLRAWFKFLREQGYRSGNPMKKLRPPKVPRRRARPASTDELAASLATVNRRRTRAMLLLAAYQGLRVHEIAAMRGEHVRGGKLRVIGKGGVDAEIPLHPLVAALAREFPAIGWWFPNYLGDGGHVTAKNVSRVLSDLIRRAGADKTGHQMRHWFGTQTLATSGGNLRVVQELLRHAGLQTVQIYTEVPDSQLAAAIEALPVPLDVAC